MHSYQGSRKRPLVASAADRAQAAPITDLRPLASAQLLTDQRSLPSLQVAQLKKDRSGKASNSGGSASQPQSAESIIKSALSSAAHSPGVENVGNGGGGATGWSIQNANGSVTVGSTRHHIYPKSSLINYAKSVSKIANTAIILEKEMNNKNFNVISTEVTYITSFIQSANRLSKTIGISASTGDFLNGSASYYWYPGNIFVGVATDYRTDDPGSGPEKKCPDKMKAGEFQAALDWGRYTVTAATKIKGIVSNYSNSSMQSEADDIHNDYTQKYKAMSNISYYTSTQMAVDWEIKDATSTTYDLSWGHQYKIYSLK